MQKCPFYHADNTKPTGSPAFRLQEIELDIKIRFANINDIPLILAFIQQKAEFDRYPASVEATAEKLKQTLFCEPPLANVLFAEVESTTVGFATFFQTYSTFLARPGIWLDDLYVKPHIRGKGVGAALMNRLFAIAKERDCGRIEWTVAPDNIQGIRFYKKQGAQIRNEVRLCRLEYEEIHSSSAVYCL